MVCTIFIFFCNIEVTHEKLALANHEPGPKCRCSECEKMKSLEDAWILKLGTFYERGLNTRDEVKTKSRCNWWFMFYVCHFVFSKFFFIFFGGRGVLFKKTRGKYNLWNCPYRYPHNMANLHLVITNFRKFPNSRHFFPNRR